MPTGTTFDTDELVAQLKSAIDANQPDRITTLAREAAPNQWAAIVPQLESSELHALVAVLPEDLLIDLLSEIEPIEAARILQTFSHPAAADLLEAMAPDSVRQRSSQEPPPILDSLRSAHPFEVLDVELHALAHAFSRATRNCSP
ncbi:MAG: hypothetical protein R2855_13015 [Thermomicrobiales bacterium]